MKVRAKPFIDVAVQRGGTGVAGVLLLLATNVTEVPFQYTAGSPRDTAVCLSEWGREPASTNARQADIAARSQQFLESAKILPIRTSHSSRQEWHD